MKLDAVAKDHLASTSIKPHASGGNVATHWVAGLFLRLLAGLGASGRRRLADSLAKLAFALGIRRRVTLDNLAQAYPELSEPRRRQIAQGAYQTMGRGIFEALAGTHQASVELAGRVEIENWDRIEPSIRAGKGLLAATAHFGNWELLGEVMASRGIPISAVVKPLRGALNARIVAARERTGLQLIPARGGLRGTIKALGEGRAVVMLLDQVLPKKHGVFVPFFGRPACTNPALSVAALRTGAPVFVVMAVQEAERLRMFVEGPFPVPNTGARDEDVLAHTAQLTEVIEGYIRRYPEQWLWLHRRWKVQP